MMKKESLDLPFSKVVSNVEILGLESSMIASGYSMRTELNEEFTEKTINRCKSLSEAGGGHEQFLTGIVVNFDLTLSNKAWVEAERYRFLNFVSSQSTMHKIAKFDLKSQCNEYITVKTFEHISKLLEIYNNNPTDDNYLTLLYNIPAGLRLTARMTTDYRCLQNIYYQRKSHRLPEWRAFCLWIESLPYAKDLILTRKKKGWIKTTEELPKNYEEVIVYDPEFDTVFLGYYFDENWHSYEDINTRIPVSDKDLWIRKPKGNRTNTVKRTETA